MHTECPPESARYREKHLGIFLLPANPVILEIGVLLLNHLGYSSIDILKDKGADGRYTQLIEMDMITRKAYHVQVHCGSRAAWKGIILPEVTRRA